MRVVIATSEAVPFAKSGGLADVTTALAGALAELGHDVQLILPHYPQLLPADTRLSDANIEFTIPIGDESHSGRVLEAELPGFDGAVLMIDQPHFYDRPSLYNDSHGDHGDNCARFVFFSRAVIETIRALGEPVDVIHANDWQTGLIPALLEIECRSDELFSKTASVFTIHNLAYQGVFWRWDMALTGLDWKYFNFEQMEFYEQLNLLKTGIVFSQKITTVSPTYANEIQTEESGCALHGTLQKRSADLVGILNGVDTNIWNPQTDPFIAKKYTVKTYAKGKAKCKAALQERMGLEQRADVPLLGMISRMAEQKGFDIISGCADDLAERDLQLCFLGTGDSGYEAMVQSLSERYPGKVAATIGFSEELAHQIEAGVDMYLMPSRYEPCGLNQMYSLTYGTVPIVHAVGGLADTVVNANSTNLLAGTANGFRFDNYSSHDLLEQVDRAISLYRHNVEWDRIVQAGMRQDWSWKQSAEKYLEVYQSAVEAVANSVES